MNTTTHIKPQGREVTIPELGTTGIVEFESKKWGVKHGILWVKVADALWMQTVEPQRFAHVWHRP